MATMDVTSAIRAIANKKFESLYLLIGEERYFSERFINQLRHYAIEGDLREFNETIFYGSDLDTGVLLDTLQSMPIMQSHRLVILKEAHLLSEKDWAALEALPPESLLSSILVVQSPSIDKRKKSIKKILERSTLIECQTPAEAARAPWIRSMAREKNLELDNEALAFLVQMGGNTLEELDRSLEQLVLFYGEGQRLSGAQLAAVLERHREESIFALAEAVGKKDRTQAIYSYRRLASQGENEVALVALLARHMRLLLKAKTGKVSGLKGPALAQKIGVNNYFLPQYLQQAETWSVESLSKGLMDLADMDRQLKSSPLPGELWIESFILRIQ